MANNQQASNSPDASPSTAPSSPESSPSSAPEVTPPISSSPSATSPTVAKLVITSLPFHTGEVGIAYAAIALGAAGGTPPYHWAISAGTLPGGLSLTSDGQLGGTPSAAGHPGFTVRVTDTAGRAAAAPGTFTIYSALAVSQPCASLCSVEEGCTVCGAFGAVSGGLGPYHYLITNDNRPNGMGVSGLTLTGQFPPPGPLGQFDLTVQVSDKFGAKRTVKANWYVFPHIQFVNNAATCFATISPSCSTQQLTYAGGTPGKDPKVVVTSVNAPNYKNVLPVGFSAVAKGGTIYVTIPAQPNNGNWNGTITVKVVDLSPCGPGSNCSSGLATITVRI